MSYISENINSDGEDEEASSSFIIEQAIDSQQASNFGNQDSQLEREQTIPTNQVQPVNKKPKQPQSNRLTNIYRFLLQEKRFKVHYFKYSGVSLLIKSPKRSGPSKLFNIIPKKVFEKIYVKNYQDAYPELKRSKIIKKILLMINSCIRFEGSHHFIKNGHGNMHGNGTCSLEVHASIQYTKKTANDHQMRAPGVTGLLKIVNGLIFYHNLKNFQLFKINLEESKRSGQDKKSQIQKQLYQIVREHLKKIPPFCFWQSFQNESYKDIIQKYLIKMDDIKINPYLVAYTFQTLQDDTYKVQDYTNKQNQLSQSDFNLRNHQFSIAKVYQKLCLQKGKNSQKSILPTFNIQEIKQNEYYDEEELISGESIQIQIQIQIQNENHNQQPEHFAENENGLQYQQDSYSQFTHRSTDYMFEERRPQEQLWNDPEHFMFERKNN